MAGLNLYTTADNVTNLKRCLEAYADALDAAAAASSGTFALPPTRKIITDNFEGETLKTGRSLDTVLRDIERGDLNYKYDFSRSLPGLSPSASALKAAVESAEGLVRVQRETTNAQARRAQSIRQTMVDDDFDAPYPSPLYAATPSPPAAKSAKPATAGTKSRMAAAAPTPVGAPRPTTASSSPAVLPATPSAPAIPAAPPAPSATATFAPIPPTLSQKEKLKQAIDQLFLRSPADFPSIGLPDWELLMPNAKSPDKYQLTHSSQSTHPDIHIEVKDDAGLAFTTEKLGAGAPTADFFKDYFTVIFNSLEASGQKYQLQNSLKDLLAGLQAQHGLANTAEIETGFKNAVTALGGPSTLKNFLQGQTLVDFEAMANPPAAASAPAPSRLNSAVPPNSAVLSGAPSSRNSTAAPAPSSTGATHSTGSSTSTSGASTPFSAARLPAAGPGAGVSQHDAALNGDGFTNGNDEPL